MIYIKNKISELLKPANINLIRIIMYVFLVLFITETAFAAPYAAMVVDAKSSTILHSRNADTRLHPASLTKMMTLYVTFSAVQSGEISMDTKVKISRKAAKQPASKLGLRVGSWVKLRYLVRAAAIMSANDASLAIAEAISGSQGAFARRMTKQAKALGMTKTTFKNPHGLTQKGHLSTARDMTILGQRLFNDFPQYYNLFSRQRTYTEIKMISNTNRRLLKYYSGADGIKTGYTRAAGFNLIASAQREGRRVIATVFGEKNSTARHRRIQNLLDMGFRRIDVGVAHYAKNGTILPPPQQALLKKSRSVISRQVLAANLRPIYRHSIIITKAIENSNADADKEIAVNAAPNIIENNKTHNDTNVAAIITVAHHDTVENVERNQIQSIKNQIKTEPKTKNWQIKLGLYKSQMQAERVIVQTSLAGLRSLKGAHSKIDSILFNRQHYYSVQFVGLTRLDADKTCMRLITRALQCEVMPMNF